MTAGAVMTVAAIEADWVLLSRFHQVDFIMR